MLTPSSTIVAPLRMTDAAPVHGAPVAGATPTPVLAGPLLSETITTTTTTTTTTERKFAPLPAPDPKRPKTLFGYFGGLQSGPSTSGAEAVPVDVKHPFPPEEVVSMTATKPRKAEPYNYIASKVRPDGSLVAQCCNYAGHTLASRTPQPIVNFQPRDNHWSGPRCSGFQTALTDYAVAVTTGDLCAARVARKQVEMTRSGLCVGCLRPEGYLLPLQQACKDNTELLYGNMGVCVRCNEQQATEFNHLPGKPKTTDISNYTHWRSVGEQTYEARNSCEEICRPCHRIDRLSSSGNRVEDPRLLPRGKRSGSPEERAMYTRRNRSKICFPKRQFVDRVKLQLGVGVGSDKRVTAEWVSNAREGHLVTFDWDHADRDGEIGGEDFKKKTHVWVGKDGEEKHKRMSPSSWCKLSSRHHTLANIGESELIPDMLRCWLTDCALHKGYDKHGRPEVTIEALHAERARVQAAIDIVLARDYPDGLKDYESDDGEKEEEDGESAE